MADSNQPKDAEALSDLRARVAQAQAKRSAELAARGPRDTSAMSLGLKLAGTFASAILVGGLIGYGIDFLAKSSPWGLLIGVGIGFAAGVRDLLRGVAAWNRAHPVDPNAPRVPDDPED
jgi:ATP synthase protein I